MELQLWQMKYIRINSPEKNIPTLATDCCLTPDTVFRFCRTYDVKYDLGDFKPNKWKKGKYVKRMKPGPIAKFIKRADAVYTNIPSPYGISDELKFGTE